MSDDKMLHFSNAPNQSALWSPANVLKAVFGFLLIVLLIFIAHGQSQTANELRRSNLESSPQVKYEYLVERVNSVDGQLDSKYLNDKASQGWILDQFGLCIRTPSVYGCEANLIFKRPL